MKFKYFYNNLSNKKQFADKIGISLVAVRKYLFGGSPNVKTMKKIFLETNGRLTPDSFYDIEQWEKELLEDK